MADIITVDTRWIGDDQVWIETGADVPGLVIEGATWSDTVRETQLILPDFCEVSGRAEPAEIVFGAEQRLSLAAA